MAIAQVFLNGVPFLACLFIVFLGRLFSELSRVAIVFLMVLLPLLASSLQEQLDGTTAGLTPIAFLGVLWSFLAAVGVTYLGLKRPQIGKRLETIAVSFLITMVLNSCESMPSLPGDKHGETVNIPRTS